MKRLLPVLLLLLALPAGQAAAATDTLHFGRFGQITLYRTSPHPNQVVLFVSGDGGWNKGVVDMARSLAGLDALVAGIDITHYLRSLRAEKASCTYPAADFENLSHYLQQKLGFARYTRPILVGYSSGATLVYAVLAQAPPGTFRGAISMGFCPDLPLNKPFCRGAGLKATAGPQGKGSAVPAGLDPGRALDRLPGDHRPGLPCRGRPELRARRPANGRAGAAAQGRPRLFGAAPTGCPSSTPPFPAWRPSRRRRHRPPPL